MEVLFGSDVHDQPRMYSALVDLANDSKADLLAFGGDYIQMHEISGRHFQQMQQVMQAAIAKGQAEGNLEEIVQQEVQKGLQSYVQDIANEYHQIDAILANANCPVIGIDGNHDTPAIARDVMKNIHLIDNGDTYDFNGVKFGAAVNSYELPENAAKLQKHFGFPIEKIMPQIDAGDYSLHDARITEQLAQANPDIIIAHKPVGDKLNTPEGGTQSAGYGKVLDSYVTSHGKPVWHGHWHGQVTPIKVGDAELPIFDHKGAMNFRATPYSAWSFTIDDSTKKISHVTFYEWMGEFEGQHYSRNQWKEAGGQSRKI